MSASKDKINRRQQIEAGTDKRTIAAAEAAAKRRKSNITYAVVAALLVVFFAFIFLYNSSIPSRHTTAVTINGQDYTAAQLNYHYSTSYNTFYNNYNAYISYGMFFDPSQSLGDQMYTEDTTWRQFFLDTAVDDMTQIQVLYDAAQAEGFTLSEEDQARYDESIQEIETAWAGLGYSSLEQFLNMNYGTGVTMDLVREESYRSFVASAYAQHVFDSYEYSQDELAAYYAEHADEFDVISYAYYTAAAEDGVDAQAVADAVNGTSLEEFQAYMSDNYDGAQPFDLDGTGDSLDEAYSQWLLDSARVPGDATAVADGEDTTVVMFLGRDDNDYAPVAFRHILIQAQDADGDGEFSQEEMDAAAAQAEDLYAQWQAGDATEDSFAALASSSSDDSGSLENGGLYETVVKGQMVEPINDWLFDPARQPGDTEVISYDGANYTGTHVVYFVGAEDQPYALTLADDTMRNDAFSDWMQPQIDSAEVVTSHLGMCGKNH